jgi:phosphoglucomutase
MDRNEIERRAKAYCVQEADPGFRAEVESLLASGDPKELEDRFYTDLEFGTGGLRGIIGGGTNRMNTLVVGRATQGLADYLKEAFPGKNLSAAIAYDSRRYSDSFALATALTFAANGIKAYLFSSLRPTPELSFAVRKLGCDTGVVVTASHNPPAYNGYKAYWNDGSQVVPPHDEGIIARVKAVKAVKSMPRAEAASKGLLVLIDKEIDDAYVAMVKNELFRPELIKRRAADVKIVYSPLHGTGAMPFERVMGELGLRVITVPEQREGNGDFPTLSYPNPEEAAALKMALDLGRREKADVVMATDPDADRLGIAVPDGKGDFALLTGNQLGSLLMDYVLLSRKELGKMPAKPVVVKTIVTTSLQDRVAASYGVPLDECLTGFKWIADLMRRYETDGSGRTYVFGSEESYGFLLEREVRDKDGISAAALTAEMTLYWRDKGKGLLERLNELYVAHGFFAEMALSKAFKGAEGMEAMKALMASFRSKQPGSLGGHRVVKIRDVQTGLEWNPAAADKPTPLPWPASNVIQWFLADGSWVTARPSGTEPKIKFYACVRAEASSGLEGAKKEAAAKVAAIETDVKAILEAKAKES